MPSPCAWFPSQTFVPKRYNPGNVGNWSGHLPFAHDLVLAVHPSLFVELGTHLGESYFGFCQAIAENGIPTLAYAIDTWKGEAHAGFYDESVYEDVLSYNESSYRSFSYLIRSLFDDALRNFADDSIDILHIDGLHTFEAISHDFYAWLPKVKPGGIVLLHDVAARHLDFGVWKLWDTLKTQGKTFAFNHAWGLGVFQKPGGQGSGSELLGAMFEGGDKTREQIRRFYSLSALELKYKHALEAPSPQEDHRLQVYLPLPDGYQEAHSQTVRVKPNRWQHVSIDLPEGIAAGLLRLDLADRPAMIEVRGIVLRSAVDGTVLWNAIGPDLAALTPGGTLIPLKPNGNDPEGNQACLFFSYGGDPQLYLPPLDPIKFDQPLTLEIWIRSQAALDSLLPLLAANKEAPPPLIDRHTQESELQLHSFQDEMVLEQQKLTQEFETDKSTMSAELQAAKSQFAANQLEREKLIQELNRKQTNIYLLEDLHETVKQAESRIAELEQRCETLEPAYAKLQSSHRVLQEERQKLQTTIDNVLRSHSWRLTSPLRKVTESLKSNHS